MPNVRVGNGSLRAVEPAAPKHPAYKGSISINGQKFWLSGWKKTGDDGSTYLSLSVDQSDGGASQARRNDAHNRIMSRPKLASNTGTRRDGLA